MSHLSTMPGHASPVNEGRMESFVGKASTTSVPSPHRRWLRWVLVVAIFVACAFFLDLGRVVAILRQVSVPWLLLILGFWTIDRLLMARKWLVLLRAQRIKIPFATLVRFYYQGTFIGTFLPSGLGGDLLRTHWVSQHTGATHETYASLLMEKMIGFLSAVNWALVGASALAFTRLHETSVGLIAGILGAFFLLNGCFLLSVHGRCHAFITRRLAVFPRYRLMTFFQRLLEAYARFAACRGALAWNGFLTLCEHGLQLLIVLMMARSLGIHVDALPFLAITAIHLLIYRLPISPDGWGVGEVTAIGLYALIGVTPESGFALAFLSHVLQMLVVLPGLWFLWQSEFMSKR